MVRLYATDIRTLEAEFDLLTTRIDAARRARALQNGNTVMGRRALAAGLLMTLVAARETLEQTLAVLPNGKPFLPDGPEFNLSHSGDYVVLAMADGAVGVDIECKRVRDPLRLSERFFHPDETLFLKNSVAPADDFLTIWTLKESYLKAEGCGFTRAANDICILPEGQSEAAARPQTRYRFYRYDSFAPGYRVAVCSTDGAFCPTIARVTF